MSSVRPRDRMRPNCLPTHRLKLTDIVGVELVHSYERADGGSTKGPRGKGPNDREFPLVNVVDENGIELGVRDQYFAHAYSSFAMVKPGNRALRVRVHMQQLTPM